MQSIDIADAEILTIAKNLVKINSEQLEKLKRLIETLDQLYDTQNVASNEKS